VFLVPCLIRLLTTEEKERHAKSGTSKRVTFSLNMLLLDHFLSSLPKFLCYTVPS
jgi:hypothetical protein